MTNETVINNESDIKAEINKAFWKITLTNTAIMAATVTAALLLRKYLESKSGE